MLIILIPAAWVALMLFGVAVCKMAALGDSAHSDATASDPGRMVHSGLVVWEDPPELKAQDTRKRAQPSSKRRHLTIHGVR
jgi:hypothetical protein